MSYIFDADYAIIPKAAYPVISIANSKDKHTELNYAAVLGTGIEFSDLEISLKYAIGLADIYNDTNVSEGVYRLSSWSINVAYIVGK